MQLVERDFDIGGGKAVRFAYSAVKRFGPWDGDPWRSYVEWARLPQLRELVSIDSMLCPSLVDSDEEEDWEHCVEYYDGPGLYWDLEYLRRRLSPGTTYRLLALARNAPEDPLHWPVVDGFVFAGHDLIEKGGSISALTNCGGFDDVFSRDELSSQGLLTSWARAVEVQRELSRRYPDEHHAQCSLWSLWTMEPLVPASNAPAAGPFCH